MTSVGNMSYRVAVGEHRATACAARPRWSPREAIADVFFHTVIVQPSADILAEVGRAVAGGQSSMKMFMCMPTFEAIVAAVHADR